MPLEVFQYYILGSFDIMLMKGLLRQHLLQTFGFWIPDWVCEVLDWLCEFRIGFARFWIARSLVTLDWVCEVLDWLCERCGDVGSVGEGARERGI